MSNQPALAYDPPEVPFLSYGTTPIDLCQRIYARNYADHQSTQQRIHLDWTALLAQNT